MKIKRSQLIILALAFLLAVGASALWYHSRTEREIQSPVKLPSMYSKLISDNDAYKAARQAFIEGHYVDAEKLYGEVLEKNPKLSSREQNLVRLDLSWAYGLDGKYEEAIPLMKDIVAKYGDRDDTKGYAVQSMAILTFYKYSDVDKIEKLIYSGAPYQDFLENGKITDVTRRKLYEYAVSFDPNLPLSNIYIARWYAERLDEDLTSKTLDADTVQKYKDKITEAVGRGDAGIKNITDNDIENLLYQVPTYEYQKGFVVDALVKRGVMLFGIPDLYFTQAIEKSTNYNDVARARFRYAAYLSAQGREKDPQAIINLSPIYKEQLLMNTLFTENILKEKSPHDLDHANIVTLAEIDPGFKEFLLAGGWTESDLR